MGCCSIAQSCLALCDPHRRLHTGLPSPSLSPGICSNSMSTESVMISKYFVLCHPLLLLPWIFRSIRVFSSESALCIRWLKYWSFNIIPSSEYSGLISFRIDWCDLLAVQGNLKSLLQHNRSKTSVLQCSALFMAQISHPYMTTGKIIALTIWTFVSKVMTLLFNTLCSISNTMPYIFCSSNSFLILVIEKWFNHLYSCSWSLTYKPAAKSASWTSNVSQVQQLLILNHHYSCREYHYNDILPGLDSWHQELILHK